jgi:hypothetical protein
MDDGISTLPGETAAAGSRGAERGIVGYSDRLLENKKATAAPRKNGAEWSLPGNGTTTGSGIVKLGRHHAE